jgi:hypothetical protein
MQSDFRRIRGVRSYRYSSRCYVADVFGGVIEVRVDDEALGMRMREVGCAAAGAWEPAVNNDLVRRALFDDKGESLPAIHAFDGCMR